MSQEFQSYDVQITEKGFLTRYEKKKDYVVTSLLSKDTPYYLYNPETIDFWVQRKESRRWYYCESSFPLPLQDGEKDDVKVMHAPWFVSPSEGLEWEKVQLYPDKPLVEVKRRGNEIYDVAGSGTYLSRRARYPMLSPYYWVPLLNKGSHWVTMSSKKPHRVHGIDVQEVDQTVVTLFDDAVLVKSLQRVTVNDGLAITRVPVMDKMSWQLWCDQPLWLVSLSNLEVARLPAGILIKEVLVSERGQVFLPHEVVEDAVCFTPGGSEFTLMGLGRGQLRPLKAIHTVVADYVLLPCTPGDKFLFPRACDVEMMCSSLSLFSRDWLSLSAQIGGADSSGSLYSTETLIQTVMSCFQNIIADSENCLGLTAMQVAARCGCSVQFASRYLLTTPGFCVWRVLNGKVHYMLEQNVEMKVGGVLNDFTSDGVSWIQILRGSGKMKEKMCFVSRELKSLVAFLRLNFCQVVRTQGGVYNQLVIRRPV